MLYSYDQKDVMLILEKGSTCDDKDHSTYDKEGILFFAIRENLFTIDDTYRQKIEERDIGIDTCTKGNDVVEY
jgi:hypothetical protein